MIVSIIQLCSKAISSHRLTSQDKRARKRERHLLEALEVQTSSIIFSMFTTNVHTTTIQDLNDENEAEEDVLHVDFRAAQPHHEVYPTLDNKFFMSTRTEFQNTNGQKPLHCNECGQRWQIFRSVLQE